MTAGAAQLPKGLKMSVLGSSCRPHKRFFQQHIIQIISWHESPRFIHDPCQISSPLGRAVTSHLEIGLTWQCQFKQRKMLLYIIIRGVTHEQAQLWMALYRHILQIHLLLYYFRLHSTGTGARGACLSPPRVFHMSGGNNYMSWWKLRLTWHCHGLHGMIHDGRLPRWFLAPARCDCDSKRSSVDLSIPK